MTQKVNTLFTNAFVLTMDGSLTQYSPGAVAVNGDSIVAVGLEQDLTGKYSADEVVDCGGRCHLPQLHAGQAPAQVDCRPEADSAAAILRSPVDLPRPRHLVLAAESPRRGPPEPGQRLGPAQTVGKDARHQPGGPLRSSQGALPHWRCGRRTR